MIIFVVSLILILDQSSKLFVSRALALHESIPVIPGIFHLTLVHNRGAAFGMLRNQLLLFVIVSLSAIVYICSVIRRSTGRLQRVALGLVLAGAVGNLIDRVAFGYVVDFLDLRVWPVFNVADSAICVGAGLLAWTVLIKPATNPHV